VTTACVVDAVLVETVTVPMDVVLSVVVGTTVVEDASVGVVTMAFVVEDVGGAGGDNNVEVGVPRLRLTVVDVRAVVDVATVVVVGGGGGTKVDVDDGGAAQLLDVLVTGQTVVLTGIVTVVMTVLCAGQDVRVGAQDVTVRVLVV
jgi:hypothetical protein